MGGRGAGGGGGGAGGGGGEQKTTIGDRAIKNIDTQIGKQESRLRTLRDKGQENSNTYAITRHRLRTLRTERRKLVNLQKRKTIGSK